MKKFILIALPLLVSACTTDVHSYIPGVTVTPTHPSYYSNKPYYNSQPPNQYYNNTYNYHQDNGKHKGQYKNKHKNKHHDD